MWKKQEETKPKAASPQAGPSTIVAPRPKAVASAPAAPFAPAAQASSPAVAAPPVAASRSSMPSPGGMGRLSKSLMIKGEISGREDLFIDCEVQGKIRIDEGTVTVGPSGRVKGDITAREIVVQGNVQGNLSGRDRVQLSQSGRAFGDVVTRRISIDDGAEIRGAVEITPTAEAPKPVTKGAPTSSTIA